HAHCGSALLISDIGDGPAAVFEEQRHVDATGGGRHRLVHDAVRIEVLGLRHGDAKRGMPDPVPRVASLGKLILHGNLTATDGSTRLHHLIALGKRIGAKSTPWRS